MNPIAQTFLVQEPDNGVAAVFLTSLDLYFQSVSSTYGVEVQIRQTDNGYPTQTILPYASKILQSNQVYSSTNASLATTFKFDTPVVLETNVQYAIVVIPLAGNPDYTIWTAELGENDVASNVPVYTNNQLGSLFISSNDLNFTPVQNESMKYTLRVANFTANAGYAVFKNANSDFIYARNFIGTFIPGEQIMVSNNVLNLAALNLTGANVFTVGETVYQTANGASPNTATGVVYFANSAVTRLSNVTGSFSNTGNTTLVGASSLKTSTISIARQTFSVSSATNVITVPDPSYTDFANGNYIYVATNGRANVQVVQITANSVTQNTLTLSTNINFTDTNAIIGRVRGDSNLYGFISSKMKDQNILNKLCIVDNVTSNSTLNFTNTAGQFMIGKSSGASAIISELVDLPYDSITAQFTQISPNQTEIDWGFYGISNSFVKDTNISTVSANVAYEFIDKQRLIMSRSNEIANEGGNNSLLVYANLSSSNTLISPYIDDIRLTGTFTHNIICPDWQLNNYTITVSNTDNYEIGDTVWQSNSTVNSSAQVIYIRQGESIIISNVTSSNTNSIATFNANGTSIITNTRNSVAANVISISYNTENTGGSPIGISRYISKNVILDANNNAEDLLAYLTAYRPSGTNLFMYGKFLHEQDEDTFSSKDWSRIPETTSNNLFSSTVNRQDLVELVYELPESVMVYGNTLTTSNTTNNISIPAGVGDTSYFNPGMFVYLADLSYLISQASVSAAGAGYSNGDIVSMNAGAFVNSSFTVTTNSTGNVVSVAVSNAGAYPNNSGLTSQATSNTTGTGTGLTLTVANTNMLNSTKFNVRQISNIPNTSYMTLDSNPSFSSGNVMIGYIPDLETKNSVFRYDQNNGISRYTNSSDSVFDGYQTFAVRIVMVANSSTIVPRMQNMRCLALQV